MTGKRTWSMWKWTGSMSMRTGKRTVLGRPWTGKRTVWTVPTHDRTKVRAQLHSCLLLHCYCFVYEHRHCMRRVTSILSRRLHSVWICSPSFATPSSRDTPLPTSNVSRFRSTQYTSLDCVARKGFASRRHQWPLLTAAVAARANALALRPNCAVSSDRVTASSSTVECRHMASRRRCAFITCWHKCKRCSSNTRR